jgi:hypothetical protein
MQQRIVQVTVTRRVPIHLIIVCPLWAGQEGLLVDPRVPRLVECCDAQLLVCVFLDNAQRIVVSVE